MGNAGDEDPDRSRAIAPAAAKQDLSGTTLASPMFAALLSRIFNWSRSGVGPRLLAAVLLFSSIVTLTLTALQLYLDYDREVGVISTRLDEIGRSTTGSLGESLWNLDQNQLKLQLDGILRLPDIRAAEVREIADRPNPIRVAVGERSTRSVVTRDYPLAYTVQGTARAIGVLHVEATLSDVYQQLLNRALIILASQAAKTFLVSLFIIYMFHILVTRHLVAIAEFVSKYSLARPPPPLHLERRPPYDPDELDKVIDAFNAMCGNLEQAYGELSEANGTLERDLKIRRRAEEDARASEQRFRDYAETASDWLWETGPDHRIISVSEQFAATGIKPEHRIGLRRWDFATDVDEEPEKWRLHITTLEAHRPFRGFVFRVAADDGSAHYVATSGKPVFDAEGRFVGYRGVGSDVTAAVRAEQAEEALHRTQMELAHVARVTTLGELAASITHEVNQPLTAIITNGEVGLRWLDREVPDLAEAREALGAVISSGRRASEIIRRLRALSRKTETQKVALNINDAISEVIPLVRQEVLSHRVSLRLELMPTLPTVLGDRVQLQQVIINLIVNGMEAMSTVTDRPRSMVLRSRLDDSGRVLVAVEDSGVGIDPENAKQLFNAFFTTKPSGMGMGLSICRSIIEAHGGRVWASNNAGPGAIFQFNMPEHEEVGSP